MLAESFVIPAVSGLFSDFFSGSLFFRTENMTRVSVRERRITAVFASVGVYSRVYQGRTYPGGITRDITPGGITQDITQERGKARYNPGER